jgi:hypothetical protein
MRVQMVRCVAAMVLAGAVAVPADGQDAKAAEILAQTRKALGGKKLYSLKTVSLEAAMARNVNNMQMSSNVEMHIEMPDKYVRIEESRGGIGMVMNSGFNGDKSIMPGGGNVSMQGGAMVFRMGPGGPVAADGPKPTPEQQAEMNKAAVRSQKTEISRLMLGWFGMVHPALPVQYTYVGEAESPDGKAHVIEAKDQDGFSARLFIDQNNYLPLMVAYQGRAPRVMTSGGPMVTHAAPAGASGQQVTRSTRELSEEERKKLASDAEKQIAQSIQQAPMVDISIFFDDWRDVDGVQFPHVMRRASAGTTNEEWTFTKVRINPKIDAKKFAADSK